MNKILFIAILFFLIFIRLSLADVYYLTNDPTPENTSNWMMKEFNDNPSLDRSTGNLFTMHMVGDYFPFYPGQILTNNNFSSLPDERQYGWRISSPLEGYIESGNWTFNMRYYVWAKLPGSCQPVFSTLYARLYYRISVVDETSNNGVSITPWQASPYILLYENVQDCTYRYGSESFNVSMPQLNLDNQYIFIEFAIRWHWGNAQNYVGIALIVDELEENIKLPEYVPILQFTFWDIDNTLIHKGENLKAYAKWSKEINDSLIETDLYGTLSNYTLSPPYTDNWTNITLTVPIDAVLGNKQVRIFVQDFASNWNKTTIENFDVYGWSGSEIYVSDSFKEKGKYRNISCLVKDADISLPLSNYYIEIYADDPLLPEGYGYTNDGWFNVTCRDQYTSYKCAIYDGYENYNASFNATFPALITILSPQNENYSTSSIPLNFITNGSVSWAGYSLDNQPKVNITENTTLYCLANTTHNIILYANDTSGSMSSSDKVYFTIDILPGDIDGICHEDGYYTVDILDLSKLGKAYGSTPSSTNWDPYADLNCNRRVDIFDLFLVGRNYGKIRACSIDGEESIPVTSVYVEPEIILSSDLIPNTTFDVNITVEQVDNLYAFEFKLKYNPNILNAVKAVNSFLNKPVYTGKRVIDNNKGEIWFSITSWTGVEPKTGKGALATITFQVKDIGRSSLELYNTRLADFDIRLIGHNTIDGYFSNIIPATIDIDPDTLNLKDKGNWVIAYIELPGYDVNDIDISTVRLNDMISAENETEIRDYDQNGILDLNVLFNRGKVIEMIKDLGLEFPADVELTVSGTLNDSTAFEGEDTIKVVK